MSSTELKRKDILDLIKMILEKQGRAPADLKDQTTLRELNFRSLDFSELCLRVEKRIARELNFEAAALRSILTVKDVCDFILRTMQPT